MVARIRPRRGSGVESSRRVLEHRAPRPGGTGSRRQRQERTRIRPQWSQPPPAQTADAARDSAAGAPCGGHDSCLALRSVRLSRRRVLDPRVSRARKKPATRQDWGIAGRRSPPPAGTSRKIRRSNGKPRHIADNSWLTIRVTIHASILFCEYSSPPGRNVQPGPGGWNPNLFSYLSRWSRRAKFTIRLILETKVLTLPMIRSR
jgi:hypothetical protein